MVSTRRTRHSGDASVQDASPKDRVSTKRTPRRPSALSEGLEVEEALAEPHELHGSKEEELLKETGSTPTSKKKGQSKRRKSWEQLQADGDDGKVGESPMGAEREGLEIDVNNAADEKTPRKRGRPRKKRDEPEVAPTPTPRKRGRPRKQPVAQQPEDGRAGSFEKAPNRADSGIEKTFRNDGDALTKKAGPPTTQGEQADSGGKLEEEDARLSRGKEDEIAGDQAQQMNAEQSEEGSGSEGGDEAPEEISIGAGKQQAQEDLRQEKLAALEMRSKRGRKFKENKDEKEALKSESLPQELLKRVKAKRDEREQRKADLAKKNLNRKVTERASPLAPASVKKDGFTVSVLSSPSVTPSVQSSTALRFLQEKVRGKRHDRVPASTSKRQPQWAMW
ncbi:hypothetical protein NDN08_000977 [Rhodosorus marinus]|uniref:Ribosome biogenesis protein NOP53 n=1 Tax=Rhodosorus marinus TaxID=101924 RepID=A0AAV8UPH4_9RHOD|nr:hypothetical protein NDN08_000977 [Rhodosorus marinus]